MFGKFIIFAILAVLLYSLFIRMKARINNAPNENKLKLVTHPSKRAFGKDFRISKIQLIITFLAVLYLIWAIITLYR
ncbi:hypothetical protein N8500_02515 [Candidatus Puniceispirillum sp.]|nr:hypothetical protein [Candidatus Puniceispirillum sp.]